MTPKGEEGSNKRTRARARTEGTPPAGGTGSSRKDEEVVPVFQIKVTLKGIRPPVWRRIQIRADSTFWDLHVAIQDVMGWLDYHLHVFRVRPKRTSRQEIEIGIPDPDGFFETQTLPGWEIPLLKVFRHEGVVISYEYDFGDGWEHTVLLEKSLAPEEGVTYPRCLAGKRACPPEDCGGSWGYENLLRILADPSDPEHEEMREWVEEDFDPGVFSPEKVVFSDPEKRLKALMRRSGQGHADPEDR
jgi:hypothetical protein